MNQPVFASVLPAARDLTRKSAHYLSRNVGYLMRDPRFFWMKTFARFELARELATLPRTARELPQQVRSLHVESEKPFFGALQTLKSEGYYVGLSLAPALLESLLQFARSTPCYADRDPALPFMIENQEAMEQRAGRKLRVASYFDQQEELPALQQLRNDPFLRSLAAAYLGCEPVYLRSEIAWSFPVAANRSERRDMAQVFHCDINDFKTLKFFFYLSDVTAGHGPHAYIKKSPRGRTLLHQLLGQRCASVPEELLLQTYGHDRMVTICGPAGTGFVGDPYYFHRGATPVEGPRLLLQIEVGCTRYRTWYFDL